MIVWGPMVTILRPISWLVSWRDDTKLFGHPEKGSLYWLAPAPTSADFTSLLADQSILINGLREPTDGL